MGIRSLWAILFMIAPPYSIVVAQEATSQQDCRQQPSGFSEPISQIQQIQNKTQCRLVTTSALFPYSLLEGKLSPFWGQEYIGADLARESVRLYSAAQDVSIGVIDSGFLKEFITGKIASSALSTWDAKSLSGFDKQHGLSVVNLANGAEPIGIAERGVIKAVAVANFTGNEKTATETMLLARPQIINMSQDINPSAQINISSISKGSIFVVSAGNSYPQTVDEFKSKNGIVVGSLNPAGWVSSASQEGEGVTILAPGDFWLTSQNQYGLTSFGATSGATPMVTGALANVMSILPDLETTEAKILLEKTALLTLNSMGSPRKNGAGTLNALKLVEVAKRLKMAGWPVAREKLLKNPKYFDFANESHQAANNAKTLLQSDDCTRRKQGLTLMRKAFLLNQSETARKTLIAVYEEEGYSVNADFYRSFEKSEFLASLVPKLKTNKDHISDIIMDGGRGEWGPFRAIRALGPASIPVFEAAVKSPSPSIRVYALQEARFLGPAGQRLRTEALNDPDPGVRATMIWEMGHDNPPPAARHYLKG